MKSNLLGFFFFRFPLCLVSLTHRDTHAEVSNLSDLEPELLMLKWLHRYTPVRAVCRRVAHDTIQDGGAGHVLWSQEQLQLYRTPPLSPP